MLRISPTAGSPAVPSAPDARAPRRPGLVPPWLVLAAGLATTATIAWLTGEAAAVRDRIRFERAAAEARQRVEARLQVYVALLRATAGLLTVEPTPSAEEFARYVERLDLRANYPGVQGIGVTVRLRPDEIAGFDARARQRGFALRPDTARDEYHAILYLEPLDARNRAALGYDMSTEPVRREAMWRARDRASAALSGKVTLVQEIRGRRQAGFLIYVPVYAGGGAPASVEGRRDSLVAYAYAPFRADDLFAGIFPATHAPDVEMRIYDGSAPDAAALLHDSRRGGDGSMRDFAALVDTLTLQIAGRDWTMLVTPAAAFAEGRRLPLTPVLLGVGSLISLTLFALARARRRALEAIAGARDLFGRVLEQAPVAICVMRGPHHIVELANPSFQQLVGRDPIGLPVRQLMPEGDARIFTEPLDGVYSTGTPWVGHGLTVARDAGGSAAAGSSAAGSSAAGGRYFNVLYYPFVRGDGKTDGVIAVIVDVTAEARARHDAEVARREAEHANRAKSDFLAAMSHELRTPLNAIQGYVQLVEMEVHGPLTAAQRDALARVQRSGSHLLSLINDVLNFAKLEAGRVEFAIADTPLKPLVTEVLQMIEPQLERKNLTCHVDVDPALVARADPEKLRQILLNLLSNAAKFTEEGGIVVRGERTRNGHAWRVRLVVSDTGIGIPDDRLHAVFDPFVQVHRGLTRTTDGTGLGLAISQDLARAMDGEIVVSSVVGRGSTFTLELPGAAG